MQRAYPWLTAILLLVFLILGGVVLKQRSSLGRLARDGHSEEESARSRRTELQRQLGAAREARIRAEKETAALRAPAGSGPAPGNVIAAWMAAHTTTVRIGDVLRDHPEYAALAAWQNRRMVMRRFGPGLVNLNLPPDQMATLKSLLDEMQTRANRASQMAMAAGVTPGSPAWQEASQEGQTAVEREITAAMGTDGNQLVHRLETQTRLQGAVQSNFEPEFEDAGMALGPDQSRSLALTLGNADYSENDFSAQPASSSDIDPATQLNSSDRRIIAEAAQTLSPAQLDIFKAHLVQRRQEAAIFRQYTGIAPGQQYRIVP